MAVRPRSAALVPGASASLRSWTSVLAVSSLSVGRRRCTGVPTLTASLSGGSAPLSSSVAPAKSFEKAVRSVRKGRWTRNELMPVSIVGGDLAMKSLSACSSRPSASKVSAMPVNSWAFCSDTGATMRAASPSSFTKPSRSVSGSASVAITGSSDCMNSGSSSSVRPTAWPRPAKVSPKPRRFSCAASRVGLSNIS